MGKHKKKKGRNKSPNKTTFYTYTKECLHKEVKIPGYQGVFTGGRDIDQMLDADVVLTLDSFGSPKYNYDSAGKIYPKQRMIQFIVEDREIPKDLKTFREILDELKAELEAGKRVHVQCIGGHGRTGTVLASLVGIMTSADMVSDPVKWVRENYCKKAVETKEQHELVYSISGRNQTVDEKEYQTYKVIDWGKYDSFGEDNFDKKYGVGSYGGYGGYNNYSNYNGFLKSDPYPDVKPAVRKYITDLEKEEVKTDVKEKEEDSGDSEDSAYDCTPLNSDYPNYARGLGAILPGKRWWGNFSD